MGTTVGGQIDYRLSGERSKNLLLQVKDLKYLAVLLFLAMVKMEPEIHRRVGAASAVVLHHDKWKDKKGSESDMFIHSICSPILTYHHKLWIVTKVCTTAVVQQN